MQVDGYIDDVVVVCLLIFSRWCLFAHQMVFVLTDIKCACDGVEVDQRLVLCSFPAVHAADGVTRPTWRYDP
jgi:hypothetical protein